MNLHLRVSLAVGVAVVSVACHNQSTDNDTGQAVQGKQPDRLAVAPTPVVATSAGPASSVAAADLARTVPPGPPNHEGSAVCQVAVGEMGIDGRTVTTQNAGNAPIAKCSAVVYVYDASKKQVARVDVPAFNGDAGTGVLPPRGSVRSNLALPAAVARESKDWFVPVVTQVVFADGQSWSAPPDRAPATRAFEEARKPEAVN